MGLRLITHCVAGSACPLSQNLGGRAFPGGIWVRGDNDTNTDDSFGPIIRLYNQTHRPRITNYKPERLSDADG